MKEDDAITVAREWLAKTLVRVCNHETDDTEHNLKKILAPDIYLVRYTSLKRDHWHIVLEWPGTDDHIINFLNDAFDSTAFEINVFSRDQVEIENIEQFYGEEGKHLRKRTDEPDEEEGFYSDY